MGLFTEDGSKILEADGHLLDRIAAIGGIVLLNENVLHARGNTSIVKLLEIQNALAAGAELTGLGQLGTILEVDVDDAEGTFKLKDDGYSETVTLHTMEDIPNSLRASSVFYSAEKSGWTYKYILPAGTYTITEVSDEGAIVNGEDFMTGSVSGEVDGEAFKGDTTTFTIEDGGRSVVAFDNSLPGGGDTSSDSCGFWHTCHMTTDDEGNPIDGVC